MKTMKSMKSIIKKNKNKKMIKAVRDKNILDNEIINTRKKKICYNVAYKMIYNKTNCRRTPYVNQRYK